MMRFARRRIKSPYSIGRRSKLITRPMEESKIKISTPPKPAARRKFKASTPRSRSMAWKHMTHSIAAPISSER